MGSQSWPWKKPSGEFGPDPTTRAVCHSKVTLLALPYRWLTANLDFRHRKQLDFAWCIQRWKKASRWVWFLLYNCSKTTLLALPSQWLRGNRDCVCCVCTFYTLKSAWFWKEHPEEEKEHQANLVLTLHPMKLLLPRSTFWSLLFQWPTDSHDFCLSEEETN